MQRIFPFILVFFVVLFSGSLLAQTPGGINYQGVARNQFLVGLNNDTITLRFNIREKTLNGAVVYSETRGTRTDSFGVFSVVIGAGGAAAQSGPIKLVKWSDTTKKFLQVELNIHDPNTPGFLNMGTTQLLSVPFSFYSDVSDSARIAAKADSAKFSEGSGRYFFSATVDPLGIQNLPEGDDEDFNIPIKFPVTVVNEGGHYNPLLSEFTAPDSGYYSFGVNIHQWMIDYEGGSDNYYVELNFALTKNSKVVKMLGDYWYYYNSNTNNNSNSEISKIENRLVLKLAKGDKVGVKLANGSDTATYIGLDLEPDELDWFNANYETTAFMEFSGYKIK